MSDNETMPNDLDLLIANINDLAREIGEMEPNDPARAVRVKELYRLTELRKSLKIEKNRSLEKVASASAAPLQTCSRLSGSLRR